MELLVKHVSYADILRDISFSLPAGARLALIGPNGTGKSMLLKAVLGLIPNVTGTVAHRGARFGVVFQENLLDARLSIKQNLRWRLSAAQLRYALNKLAQFDLDPKVEYGVLSGGEKRVVNYVRALAVQPNCLVLDELSAGIDVRWSQQIWTDILAYTKQHQCSLVYVSHALAELKFADQVLVLQAGKVKYFGSNHDFMQQMPRYKIVCAPQPPQYFPTAQAALAAANRQFADAGEFEIHRTTYQDLFTALTERS